MSAFRACLHHPLTNGGKLENVLLLHLSIVQMSSRQTSCFFLGCRLKQMVSIYITLTGLFADATYHKILLEIRIIINKTCSTRKTSIPGHSKVKRKERQSQEITSKDSNNVGGRHCHCNLSLKQKPKLLDSFCVCLQILFVCFIYPTEVEDSYLNDSSVRMQVNLYFKKNAKMPNSHSRALLTHLLLNYLNPVFTHHRSTSLETTLTQ